MAAAAKKKSTTEKPKKQGVGDVAIAALRDRKTNEEALAAVQKKFPDASVSISSIAWYRNKLRSDGEKVPTARELKAERAKGKSKGK